MNEQQIEEAGQEEYTAWRRTKDTLSNVAHYAGDLFIKKLHGTQEFVKQRMEQLPKDIDNAIAHLQTPEGAIELTGPGKVSSAVVGMTKNAASFVKKLKLNDRFDIEAYFKPVQTQEQMGIALNKLKHDRTLSNYDDIMDFRHLPKDDYRDITNWLYGGFVNVLKAKRLTKQAELAEQARKAKLKQYGLPD